MTLGDWLWLALAVIGPLPLVWVWKWWQARRAARIVRETLEYRRQMFGGFIREPGKRGVTPLERPE